MSVQTEYHYDDYETFLTNAHEPEEKLASNNTAHLKLHVT